MKIRLRHKFWEYYISHTKFIDDLAVDANKSNREKVIKWYYKYSSTILEATESPDNLARVDGSPGEELAAARDTDNNHLDRLTFDVVTPLDILEDRLSND